MPSSKDHNVSQRYIKLDYFVRVHTLITIIIYFSNLKSKLNNPMTCHQEAVSDLDPSLTAALPWWSYLPSFMTYLSSHVRYLLLSALPCIPITPYYRVSPPLWHQACDTRPAGGPCPVHVSHYWDIPSSYTVSVHGPCRIYLYICASRKASDDECLLRGAPWLDATVSGVSDQLST